MDSAENAPPEVIFCANHSSNEGNKRDGPPGWSNHARIAHSKKKSQSRMPSPHKENHMQYVLVDGGLFKIHATTHPFWMIKHGKTVYH